MSEGHWETHSHSSSSVKVGDNPAIVKGKDASAEGAFDHGKPIVTASHSSSYTNEGHPNTLEIKDESGAHQKSIK
ncbi:unnamed protein product [Adineta ricciae]|uniref:Uncharacterized protein n=1 Tax=Adineta ricciae TaxID=249248 RepID=A0A815QHU1_ADIRI|nr:unnamed protein product [Adineta ricciae]CAF1463427.1 unnamed protein product [Adineta ricciae]